MKFVQSSAKDNSNIHEVFTDLAANIIAAREANIAPSTKQPDTIQLSKGSSRKHPSHKGCNC